MSLSPGYGRTGVLNSCRAHAARGITPRRIQSSKWSKICLPCGSPDERRNRMTQARAHLSSEQVRFGDRLTGRRETSRRLCQNIQPGPCGLATKDTWPGSAKPRIEPECGLAGLLSLPPHSGGAFHSWRARPPHGHAARQPRCSPPPAPGNAGGGPRSQSRRGL